MSRVESLSKWTIIVLAALMLAYLAIDKFTSPPHGYADIDGSVTLSWTAPTENEDHSPLTDLTGYVIHYGTSARQYSDTIYVGDRDTTSYRFEDLSPGTYYFTITAINADGVESTFSDVVAMTVP